MASNELAASPGHERTIYGNVCQLDRENWPCAARRRQIAREAAEEESLVAVPAPIQPDVEYLEIYQPEVLIREAMRQLGLDVENQHFKRTPERWVKVIGSYMQPVDLQEVISGGFDDDDLSEEPMDKNMVFQAPIPFMGFCAHHLLPFFGAAAVAYLPDKRLVGLSKLTRLVYAAGHISPTTQEHITNLVADALVSSKAIQPRGVAVFTSALHGCMSSRGVESPETRTVATALRGAFKDIPALEDKFTALATAAVMR